VCNSVNVCAFADGANTAADARTIAAAISPRAQRSRRLNIEFCGCMRSCGIPSFAFALE
jgi:sulfite reductase beta subunit-like hemoprotein